MKLLIKLTPLITRRYNKTLGYVVIIEEDTDSIVINKNMCKP